MGPFTQNSVVYLDFEGNPTEVDKQLCSVFANATLIASGSLVNYL